MLFLIYLLLFVYRKVSNELIPKLKIFDDQIYLGQTYSTQITIYYDNSDDEGQYTCVTSICNSGYDCSIWPQWNSGQRTFNNPVPNGNTVVQASATWYQPINCFKNFIF